MVFAVEFVAYITDSVDVEQMTKLGTVWFTAYSSAGRENGELLVLLAVGLRQ